MKKYLIACLIFLTASPCPAAYMSRRQVTQQTVNYGTLPGASGTAKTIDEAIRTIIGYYNSVSGITLNSVSVFISNPAGGPSYLTGPVFTPSVGLPANDLRPFAGFHGVLTSTGTLAVTFGAVGTGETLSSTDQLDGWTNSGYDTFTVSGTDITQALEAGANSVVAYDQIASGTGKLFKFVLGTFTNTGTNKPNAYLGDVFSTLGPSAGQYDARILAAGMAAQTVYFTNIIGPYFGFRNPAGVCDWAATGMSLKQVTTPSAGGLWFMAPTDTGFVYNAATYSITVTR
jgi:hypothetical protein